MEKVEYHHIQTELITLSGLTGQFCRGGGE
jgi:hypothetical protein